jgi:hypothetical protein
VIKTVRRLRLSLGSTLSSTSFGTSGSGVFETRLRLNGFEPRLRLRLRLSLSSLKSLWQNSLEYLVIQYLHPFSMLKITFVHFKQFLEIAIRL